MKNTVIKVENLQKKYKLGVIGARTLQATIQSYVAKKLNKEDPNSKIGAKKAVNGEFWALKGLDFEVYEGDILGIIGRNGAGKSTLLKLLSQITSPTKGDIYIKGKISSMLEVGTGFHRELTGRENVYLNGAILGMKKHEVDQKFDEIVEFAEIREFIDTPVKRYSSGMYVKLAFSVAAHLNSEILIMDEVLAVGDMKFQKKCLDKMKDLARNQGKTILYVSHNMSTISDMCNRCIFIEEGRIKYDGEVERAIQMYYDDFSKNGSFVDLTQIKRPKRFTPTVLAESVQAGNESGFVFDEGEKLKFTLNCKALEDVEDISIRLTINYNYIPVGTSISDNLGDIKKSEIKSYNLVLDLNNLQQGTYSTKLIVFSGTTKGIPRVLDFVDDAFSFNIVNGKMVSFGWNNKHWGSVNFPKMYLEGGK